MLCAADFAFGRVQEIAVAGSPGDGITRRLLDVIHSRFLPNRILALVEPGDPGSQSLEGRIPLLRGKRMIAGRTTVFVCRDHRCNQPVTDVAALERLLDEDAGASARVTGESAGDDRG
jgi:hypothetical protein